jgi:hypothetical protein
VLLSNPTSGEAFFMPFARKRTRHAEGARQYSMIRRKVALHVSQLVAPSVGEERWRMLPTLVPVSNTP